MTITDFVTPITSIQTAITGQAPTILAAVGTIAAGLIAFSLGVRLLKRFAR